MTSYFAASFLTDADLDTMRKAFPTAREQVAIDWSCLTSPLDLVNALTLVYSTHRAVKVMYITVPKTAAAPEDDVSAADGASPNIHPATRFQNLVYDCQDVHWSVVGKMIHAVLKQDAFWTEASTAYKMSRLETVKERPALPAVKIASIAKTWSEMKAGTPLPRLSKKAMKRLQPADVKAELAELASPTWQPPCMHPPSLISDVHDADKAQWL